MMSGNFNLNSFKNDDNDSFKMMTMTVNGRKGQKKKLKKCNQKKNEERNG